jgi:hypothetical protein
MYDLQVLAWQADITRVSTFQVATGMSGIVYRRAPFAMRSTRWSHHSNIEENIQRFTVLNAYHTTLFRVFPEHAARVRWRCDAARPCRHRVRSGSATATSTITPTCRSSLPAARRAS